MHFHLSSISKSTSGPWGKKIKFQGAGKPNWNSYFLPFIFCNCVMDLFIENGDGGNVWSFISIFH
jgi:hypothetical protein